MERLAQLLDDLDDLVWMFRLLGERIRRVVLVAAATLAILSIQAGGIALALAHPPLALATASILFVTLLYHSVTSPRFEPALK